jgi:hypothetical protein
MRLYVCERQQVCSPDNIKQINFPRLTALSERVFETATSAVRRKRQDKTAIQKKWTRKLLYDNDGVELAVLQAPGMGLPPKLSLGV